MNKDKGIKLLKILNKAMHTLALNYDSKTLGIYANTPDGNNIWLGVDCKEYLAIEEFCVNLFNLTDSDTEKYQYDPEVEL